MVNIKQYFNWLLKDNKSTRIVSVRGKLNKFDYRDIIITALISLASALVLFLAQNPDWTWYGFGRYSLFAVLTTILQTLRLLYDGPTK